MNMEMAKRETATVLRQIKNDHDTVRELMAKIDQAQTVNWEDVITLYTFFKGHFHAEEEVVFPALRTISQHAEKLVQDLIDEHEQATAGLLKMIDKQEFDRLQFRKIMDIVEHHFTKEESSGFKAANEHMTREQLKAALEPFVKAEQEARMKSEEKLR